LQGKSAVRAGKVDLLNKAIGISDFSWDPLLVSFALMKKQSYNQGLPTDSARISGGFLANPATQYPAFRNVAFFHTYPYALPGLVSGAFCMSAAIMSFVSLNEVSRTTDVD
jgi:hypothetical protein